MNCGRLGFVVLFITFLSSATLVSGTSWWGIFDSSEPEASPPTTDAHVLANAIVDILQDKLLKYSGMTPVEADHFLKVTVIKGLKTLTEMFPKFEKSLGQINDIWIRMNKPRFEWEILVAIRLVLTIMNCGAAWYYGKLKEYIMNELFKPAVATACLREAFMHIAIYCICVFWDSCRLISGNQDITAGNSGRYMSMVVAGFFIIQWHLVEFYRFYSDSVREPSKPVSSSAPGPKPILAESPSSTASADTNTSAAAASTYTKTSAAMATTVLGATSQEEGAPSKFSELAKFAARYNTSKPGSKH